MSRPFAESELVMLVDRKKRRYLTSLVAGGEFHTHTGVISHDKIIGENEGETLRSSSNAAFLALRPTMSDYILKMKRGAQVIYPKDLGPILMLADIFPGARVFESGLGSGALSMTMLRAGAHIVGYEIREDFAKRAVQNVTEFLGADALKNYEVHVRSAYEKIEHGPFDRVVLDLPEPWNVVESARESLNNGGIILAYNPSIIQATKFRAALDAAGFGMCKTTEYLERGWYIEASRDAVRPDHRMVAHTGFLTVGRKIHIK